MATRKKTTATTRKAPARKKQDTAPLKQDVATSSGFAAKDTSRVIRKSRPTKKLIFLLIIIALAALLFYKKNLLIAATVNGAPISNIELMSRMNESFREGMLNQMVNEQIIKDEAKKKGITVSNDELNAKIADFEKQIGGAEQLDAYLSQRGQSRKDLERQLPLQIMMEKLYKDEATVSGEEVSAFVAENGSLLQASDSAARTVEATELLKQQKLDKILTDKFTQLRNSAKITIF